ncbi:SlyX family protein [Oricola thermophila]|uniref:Protein SlyX homolog n=1 Tax=Oricola thermophila TaxID=2742145 RepID=A0A6N1VK25_9HYPH|nr:SlyX family protein [Oricola thermophila]QKV19742.1 SlyX family protein [Oricola thermophila]
MAKNDTDRLDELEIIVAHQARTVEDLNEAVIRQDREIRRLEKLVEALVERFQAVEEQVSPDVPVTKPPHW